MKNLLFIFILDILVIITKGNLFCPKNASQPKDIQINTDFQILEEKNGINYSTIIFKNDVFIRQSPKVSISSNYYDSSYCPTNYYIPQKEDYEKLLLNLGKDAYSFLTYKYFFNMTKYKYLLTKNKTSSGNFYLVYLDGNEVKIKDFNLRNIGANNISLHCKLNPPKTAKFVFPNNGGDIKLGFPYSFYIDNKYFNGHLYRINQTTIYEGSNVTTIFLQSGRQRIEFWGNLVTGETIYLCEYVYVKKRELSSSQEYSFNSIKKIETDFDMLYTSSLHFEHSNSPVSPRIDGGYYIAFTDTLKFLHVLSYDKNDNLITNFNTTQKGYILDILATDYGFSIYIRDAVNTDHSYLTLYNKNFELINTVTIMNNKREDKDTDSNINKQIIKYGSDGKPVFGMRFIYDPHNGKLAYSRGRIFLIFAHYNHFLDSGGHTGDTVATFNDVIKDLDFGITWGASHSLIQSITIDDFYFWTAALSDAYPEGISVEYTSKKDLTNAYDPVNKKYNSRRTVKNDQLAGYITPYHNGRADGKLGGITYFEKLGLYVMAYAKTPVASSESNGGKNIIYITQWQFENNQITNIETKIVKNFGENNNVMQLRAGKFGDNKLFIIYSPTTTKGNNGYGYIPRGAIPNIFIIEFPSFKFIINDQKVDNLLMNTNEDLRTFNDGVLIWATSNSKGKLVINKVGEPRLDESYDDIYYILSPDDLIEIEYEDNQDHGLSGLAIFGIVIGVIFGVIILVIGGFLLYKYIKFKKTGRDFNFNNLKKELLFKN